jgi:chromosome partitioning protein
MRILIANQKGGAGKSTLCILFANYLAIEKKEEVLILDMDFQASVHEKWESDWEVYRSNIRAQVYNEIVNAVGAGGELPSSPKSKLTDEYLGRLIDTHKVQFPDLEGYKPLLDGETLDETRLYQVMKQDMGNYSEIKPLLANYEDGHVIIDLPGKMDDDNLVGVYQDADLIIVPTGYDQMTNVATLTFAQVVNAINPNAKVVFIPNRIKPGVKYELKADVHKYLKPFGIITEEVKDSVMFQRINTYSISKELLDNIEPVFDQIYTKYLEANK